MVHIPGLFEAFNKVNVLIVGDVMIDRYLTGRVDRISPEAPVPVVHLQNTENRLGGAANVALNVNALGATAYLCSVIGEDEMGDEMMKLLPAAGLATRGVSRSSARTTTVKTRIMAQGQQLLRVDSEKNDDLGAADLQRLLTTIGDLLESREIHVILFQDYNKGVLSIPAIQAVMLEAIKRDIPTAVDPKAKNFWAYKHVTLFKPNLREIRAQLDQPVLPEPASLQQAAREISQKLGNRYTMITLSEKGLFLDDARRSTVLPTQPRSIADVSGAGDTVISIAALGLALDADMAEVAELANLAGGQVCEKLGVVPVDKVQLEREYEQLVRKGKR